MLFGVGKVRHGVEMDKIEGIERHDGPESRLFIHGYAAIYVSGYASVSVCDVPHSLSLCVF